MKVRTARSLSPTSWVLVAFMLWFGSYAYLYVFGMGGPKPLYSYLLLLSFVVLWVLYSGVIPGIRDHGLRALLGWLGLYIIYGVLEFMNSTQDPVALQVFITLGEAVLLVCAFALMMADSMRMRWVHVVLLLLTLVGVAINLWDFFDPTFSKDPGRAAGLYVNPNISGHFIAMAMVGGIPVVPRRLRLAYLMIGGLGVLFTFSRASWIIWGLAVIWLGWLGHFGGLRKRITSIALAVLIGAGFTGLLFAGNIGSYVAGTSLTRYLNPNTEARLGIGASSLSGYAANEREKMITVSIRTAMDALWVGHGLGYTAEWQYPVGPHDMYLLFLVEGGIPGMMLYVGLMIVLWCYSTGIGRVITLQLLVASFFTHNQLEQPAFLMMMAFVSSHGFLMRMERRKESIINRVLVSS